MLDPDPYHGSETLFKTHNSHPLPPKNCKKCEVEVYLRTGSLLSLFWYLCYTPFSSWTLSGISLSSHNWLAVEYFSPVSEGFCELCRAAVVAAQVSIFDFQNWHIQQDSFFFFFIFFVRNDWIENTALSWYTLYIFCSQWTVLQDSWIFSLKGLSHEIDFKNFDKNLQNLT